MAGKRKRYLEAPAQRGGASFHGWIFETGS